MKTEINQLEVQGHVNKRPFMEQIQVQYTI